MVGSWFWLGALDFCLATGGHMPVEEKTPRVVDVVVFEHCEKHSRWITAYHSLQQKKYFWEYSIGFKEIPQDSREPPQDSKENVPSLKWHNHPFFLYESLWLLPCFVGFHTLGGQQQPHGEAADANMGGTHHGVAFQDVNQASSLWTIRPGSFLVGETETWHLGRNGKRIFTKPNKDNLGFTLEVQGQAKWLVSRMINVKDSRSYQWAKFGFWTSWVYCPTKQRMAYYTN